MKFLSRKRLPAFIVLTLFLMCSYGPSVAALSDAQLKIFQNKIYYFNTAASCSTNTPTAPTTTPGSIPQGGEDVGATEFTDGQGYHGDSLDGTYSYAELSPPGTAATDVSQNTATNLGGLAYQQKVAITYKGKTVVAEKLDIGQGGPDIDGKTRAIDLHYSKTAQALGITDPNNWSGVVHVEGVVDSTTLGPVSDPSTLVDSSSNASNPTAPTPNGSCCSTVTTTTLTGKDNEEKTWNFFKGTGLLSDPQIAGIMGDLQQESSFVPENMEVGGTSQNPADAGSGGYGLAQWTPGTTILTAASDNHVSGNIYDLLTQLNIIMAQMQGQSPKSLPDIIKGLQQINDPSQAAAYFNSNFEGGTDPGGIRESNAVHILGRYGGSVGSNPGNPSTGSCVSSADSPDCTTATGDVKILCEAKKYDPVDYVWGGGHGGGAAYHAACPTIEANNSACGLDCSGLVSVAVYDAFGNNASWDTGAIISDHANWKEVLTLSQLQPGDVIEPDASHVEIVDHVTGNTIYTFGAHTSNAPQPDQVGPTSYVVSSSSAYRYFHYVGQGGS